MRTREASSSARLSALAIEVASSSVNLARRASVSVGSGCSPEEATPITPHRRPSTMIGVPTDERTPVSLAATLSDPDVSA